MPQKQRYFCQQPTTILFVEIAQNLLPTHTETHMAPQLRHTGPVMQLLLQDVFSFKPTQYTEGFLQSRSCSSLVNKENKRREQTVK